MRVQTDSWHYRLFATIHSSVMKRPVPERSNLCAYVGTIALLGGLTIIWNILKTVLLLIALPILVFCYIALALLALPFIVVRWRNIERTLEGSYRPTIFIHQVRHGLKCGVWPGAFLPGLFAGMVSIVVPLSLFSAHKLSSFQAVGLGIITPSLMSIVVALFAVTLVLAFSVTCAVIEGIRNRHKPGTFREDPPLLAYLRSLKQRTCPLIEFSSDTSASE